MKKEIFLRNALGFGFLIIAALLASRFHFRLDLTHNSSFTVSPYTRGILDTLDSEVNITWYRSSALRGYTPALRYIEDYLGEYREFSRNRIAFSIIDPSGSKETKKIGELGIIPRQTDIRQKEGTVSADLYSGLLVEYRGRNRVIPFLADTDTLEYDLTRLIVELQEDPEKSGLPNTVQIIFGRNPALQEYQYVEPWLEYAGFSTEILPLPVRNLDPRKQLLVIGSSNIDSQTTAAIDQFVSGGGNAAFFVSGNTVNTLGDWSARPKNGDRLIAYLAGEGFDFAQPLILDISNYRITMPALDNSRNEYINYPFWVTSLKENMARDHVLLSGVASLQFYWPSFIEATQGSGGQTLPLVSSSSATLTMNEPYDTNPFGKQLSLFSSGKSKTGKTLVAAAVPKGRLIAVADEYMISSLIEYTNSDSNLDFLVNCIEWISGKDSLLALKNKKKPVESESQTGFERAVSGIQISRIVNIVVLPSLIVLTAAVTAFKRKKKK